MRRALTATPAALCLAATARAHFVFLLPAAAGTKAAAARGDGGDGQR